MAQRSGSASSCKRQGYIEMDKETYLRIDGGRLTASEEKTPAKAQQEKKQTN